jgi:hypothetical protein
LKELVVKGGIESPAQGSAVVASGRDQIVFDLDRFSLDFDRFPFLAR